MKEENPMEVVNNVVKWSFAFSGMAALMSLTIVFLSWFAIQALAIIVNISA